MNMASVRFEINMTGLHEVKEQFRRVAECSTLTLHRIALAKAVRRERRAHLNVLRATRRKRPENVREWKLAKARVKNQHDLVDCVVRCLTNKSW
jgi:hypothetical protein